MGSGNDLTNNVSGCVYKPAWENCAREENKRRHENWKIIESNHFVMTGKNVSCDVFLSLMYFIVAIVIYMGNIVGK